MTAVVRTAEQAYEAGAAAAADVPPLTEEQVTAVALILAASPPGKAKAA